MTTTTNENPAAVRVCAIADIQCSRGCGTGPCKREAESSQPAAAPTHSPECEYIKTDNPWAACTCGIGSPNNPAPSPADERAAFSVAQTCALKHAISSLTADGLEASARELEALLATPAPSPVDERAALSEQDIYDKFSFLEGLVNESTYVQIADTAIEIARAGYKS